MPAEPVLSVAEQKKKELRERYQKQADIDADIMRSQARRPLSKAYSSLDTAGGGTTVTEEEERLNQQSYMKDSD